MPESRIADAIGTGPWEYSDEQAQLVKRIVFLEAQIAALVAELATMKAAQKRVAEYQGVTHLLAPQ